LLCHRQNNDCEEKVNAFIKKNLQEENSKTSQFKVMSLVFTRGRQKWFHAYEIWDDIAYVDAFGDTWTQFNGECSIHVGLLNVVRTSSSYSQLGWVMHFLQNFLTRSIVMSTSLPIRAAKVGINILFAAASYRLPVRYRREIQEHVAAKGAECGGYRDSHGMHGSRQSLVDNVSGLSQILWWIAVEQYSQYVAHCLVHTFADQI
jgi:hypothetical protein